MTRWIFGLCLALLASPAAAFTAVNGVSAFSEGGQGQFEVVSEPGSGPRQIWCAAAQFARFELGAAANTRIYLSRAMAASPRTPRARSASFTIAPNEALKSGPKPGDGGNYSVSLSKLGYNLRLAHAEGFCERIIDDIFD
ncbi:hypothetical protein [Lentibacter sp.]|uniref:hypothetical protein n=1 Tax=Lentibacter sp. TaxID=2024994 RepID=UPI003F6B3252